MPSEYYNLPSTDNCLDLSQHGIENEGKGFVPCEGWSGLCESGVEERLRHEDTGLCQLNMPPLEELLHVLERSLCYAMDSHLPVHHHRTLVSSSKG